MNPEEIHLPFSAPNFIVYNGDCYSRTEEKVLPKDLITNYSGDYEDCNVCNSQQTPTVTATPTQT